MATSTIKPKRGTTAQWAASGRVLEENEWGVEVTRSGHYILRIGDGEHRFHELPAVIDTPMLHEIEAQVEEMHLETKGFRDAAEASAGASATSAAQAKTSSDAAKSALQSVQSALDNLPDGNTLVINNLTTGGTSAALSAEMGKVLWYGLSDASLAHAIMAFKQIQEDYNITNELHILTLAQTGLKWPFNNKENTIALAQLRENTNYSVEVAVLDYSGGRLGDIRVLDRARNGFKLLHDGSASIVKVAVRVSGGMTDQRITG